MVSSKPLARNKISGRSKISIREIPGWLDWVCFFGQHVSSTAVNAIRIPVIFSTVAFSLYKYKENRKGMIKDNLFATEATATPIFWAVSAMTLKSEIKIVPITQAHGNHGW